MLPVWLGSLIAFTYGIVVGSFLNVCIYRWPNEQSIVKPPSHCPKCNTRLKGVDLVPLFSFLFLGRKCRYCRAPISWRYFTIELITGLMFLAVYLKFGYTIDFFVYVLFLSALIVAFAVDIEYWIIPDEVSIIGVILGLGREIAHLIAGDWKLGYIPIPFTDFEIPMLSSIIGMVVCGGLFFLIAFVSYYVFRPKDDEARKEYEGAMGMGDVKLAAAMGAVLHTIPALVSFAVAIFIGTIVGVGLIIFKIVREKKGMPWRTEIPFGPYMVIGAVAVIFAWPQFELIWQAWVNMVVPS